MKKNIYRTNYKKLSSKLILSFYSLDIAKTIDSKYILVEIGDFQVSDMSKSGDENIIRLCYKSIKNLFIEML